MPESLTPEGYFFIYAFPAITHCAGKITPEEFSSLESQAVLGKGPSLERLRRLFPNAFNRIEHLTGKIEAYTIEDYRSYWWIEHNRIIDHREKGYEQVQEEEAELCKVQFPIVKGLNGRVVTITYPTGPERKGLNYRNLPLQPGQRVSIHKGHIVEMILESVYTAYFPHAH